MKDTQVEKLKVFLFDFHQIINHSLVISVMMELVRKRIRDAQLACGPPTEAVTRCFHIYNRRIIPTQRAPLFLLA